MPVIPTFSAIPRGPNLVGAASTRDKINQDAAIAAAQNMIAMRQIRERAFQAQQQHQVSMLGLELQRQKNDRDYQVQQATLETTKAYRDAMARADMKRAEAAMEVAAMRKAQADAQIEFNKTGPSSFTDSSGIRYAQLGPGKYAVVTPPDEKEKARLNATKFSVDAQNASKQYFASRGELISELKRINDAIVDPSATMNEAAGELRKIDKNWDKNRNNLTPRAQEYLETYDDSKKIVDALTSEKTKAEEALAKLREMTPWEISGGLMQDQPIIPQQFRESQARFFGGSDAITVPGLGPGQSVRPRQDGPGRVRVLSIEQTGQR